MWQALISKIHCAFSANQKRDSESTYNNKSTPPSPILNTNYHLLGYTCECAYQFFNDWHLFKDSSTWQCGPLMLQSSTCFPLLCAGRSWESSPNDVLILSRRRFSITLCEHSDCKKIVPSVKDDKLYSLHFGTLFWYSSVQNNAFFPTLQDSK